jgi:hypothetical protein
MAEFQWWLLLLGLVAGGGIVAVVYLDGARREQDIEDAELPAEATWISERLIARGHQVDAATAERVLLEHRSYRLEPPPDRLEPVVEPSPGFPRGSTDPSADGIGRSMDDLTD